MGSELNALGLRSRKPECYIRLDCTDLTVFNAPCPSWLHRFDRFATLYDAENKNTRSRSSSIIAKPQIGQSTLGDHAPAPAQNGKICASTVSAGSGPSQGEVCAGARAVRGHGLRKTRSVQGAKKGSRQSDSLNSILQQI